MLTVLQLVYSATRHICVYFTVLRLRNEGHLASKKIGPLDQTVQRTYIRSVGGCYLYIWSLDLLCKLSFSRGRQLHLPSVEL